MEEFILIIVVLSAVFGGILGGADLLTANRCSNYAEETGIETKYRHLDSCYLKTPAGWMPWAEFKARAMSKEISK